MRKWLVISVVVLVLAVGLPRPAGATAPTEYIVTFTIVSGFQPVTCQSQSKAHSCSSYRAVLAGDIVGSATATHPFPEHVPAENAARGAVYLGDDVGNVF